MKSKFTLTGEHRSLVLSATKSLRAKPVVSPVELRGPSFNMLRTGLSNGAFRSPPLACHRPPAEKEGEEGFCPQNQILPESQRACNAFHSCINTPSMKRDSIVIASTVSASRNFSSAWSAKTCRA